MSLPHPSAERIAHCSCGDLRLSPPVMAHYLFNHSTDGAREWDPPAPMSTVLSRIPGETAKADFELGVVRITAHEYETALR